ncbi:MAG: transglycosylase domain-containing protein [Fibrobacterales bacterium]|nr:transglycosylase domain-containing protein [Fibrobacterales bacterium]
MDDLLLDLESGGRPRGETAWRKGVRRGSPKPKSGGRRRGKRGGRPFLKALLVLAVLALALGAAFYAWIFLYLPSQDPDGKFDRAAIVASLGSESEVYASDGKTLLGSFFDATHRRYVRHSDMPPELLEAIIAAEDARFLKHNGVDPLGITRAAFQNLKAGRVTAGGSTLTQQTAKNLFGRQGRTFGAKAQEFVDALRLERHFSKQEILEFYLNQFHVAGNGRGVGIAAEHYFDRPLRELNVREIAFIAGSVKGPGLYDPHVQKSDSLRKVALGRAEVRSAYVLRRMREIGALDEAGEKAALRMPLRFKEGQFRTKSDRLLDLVAERMDSPWMQEHLLSRGVEDWRKEGVRIVTTIDAKLQAGLMETVADSLAAMEKWLGWEGRGERRLEGGLVVLRNGELLASVGGRTPEGFDRVWTAKRLFGSVWKPLLIAHALELGWDEETLVENENNLVEDGRTFYWPRPDHSDRGERVTLRWMAVRSENVAAVRLLERLLDRLAPGQQEALAARFGLTRGAFEGEEQFKRRLDSLGIPLNSAAEEAMRYGTAKREVVRALSNSGRRGAARLLENLPLGGPQSEKEAARLRKQRGTAEQVALLKGTFRNLRNLLRLLEEDGGGAELVCSPDGSARAFVRGAPEAKALRDSGSATCLWEEMPEAERERVLLWKELTVADVRATNAEMGSPLSESERLETRNLLRLPLYRDLLARRSFVDFVHRAGVEQELPEVASLPLGTGEIRLAELARAYQTLLTGNRTRTSDPEFFELFIREIRDRSGKPLFEDSLQSVRVLDGTTVGKMRSILQEVVRAGTGRRADRQLLVTDASGNRLHLPLAGKTGTTNGSRTVSFAGGIAGPKKDGAFSYDEGWTVAAWAGADRNLELRGKKGSLSGASGALPLWIGAAQLLARDFALGAAVDPDDLEQQLTGRVHAEIGIPTHRATVDPMTGALSKEGNAVSVELCGEEPEPEPEPEPAPVDTDPRTGEIVGDEGLPW